MLEAIVASGLCSSLVEARGPTFIRGDASLSTRIELADAVTVLRMLFQVGAPHPCLDALDADDDGAVSVTDAVYILLHLFLGGAPPPPPFPACDADPTGDELGCERNAVCPRQAVADLVEGDGAVILVIDRSGTMQDSGELTLAKREVVAWLDVAPAGVEFAIVFVDKGLLRFPREEPLAFTDEATQLESAITFVQSMTGGSGSCVLEGLLSALESASTSGAKRKAIVFLTDGTATCPGSNSEALYMSQTLERLEVENVDRVPIHAVGVGSLAPAYGQFLQALVAANGGELVLLPR